MLSALESILDRIGDAARNHNRMRAFTQYSAALVQARATGADADIAAARELHTELNGLFDSPSTRISWADVTHALGTKS
jgi:hypothetical protein